MKIWIKLVAGIIIGTVLSFVLDATGNTIELFSFMTEIVIRVGRYLLFPLILFSAATAAYELRQTKKTIGVLLRALLYPIVAAVLFIITGILVVLFFSPERIPIIIESQQSFQLPDIQNTLRRIFPANVFQVFVTDSSFVFPLLLFSVLFGLQFTFDRLTTRPVTQVFDSASRIFYRFNTIVTEVLGLGFIIITAYSVLNIRSITEISLYREVFLVIAVVTVLIVFGFIPLMLYLLGKRENPYKLLYGLMAPAFAGLLSGDTLFSTAFLTNHGKENLGIPRRVGAIIHPLYAMFSRAGTAVISAMAFIIILNSYSNLDITFFQILWVFAFSLLVSFLLFSYPGMGVVVSLAFLSSLYGNGLEEGFLILNPVTPILISAATMMDVITSGAIAYLISLHEGVAEEKEIGDFI
ncbi:MAG: dicarboxylate/amino acid:cation symporter [Spirochaetia bacterium]